MSGSLTFVPALELFFLFVLYNSNSFVFILVCYILLLSIKKYHESSLDRLPKEPPFLIVPSWVANETKRNVGRGFLPLCESRRELSELEAEDMVLWFPLAMR